MMRRLRAPGTGKRRAMHSTLGISVQVLAVAAFVGIAIVASSGGARSAGDSVNLNGGWAPFNRCPVDDPAMLAADGSTLNDFCVSASSAGGAIKLGNTSAPAGDTGLQFGLVGSVSTSFAVVPPTSGAIVAAPVDVPGGLLGLMCPSTDPVVLSVCNLITDNTLNAVSAVVQSAGSPSDFNFSASAEAGVPIFTMPIKVQLQNPLLGSTCFIGSDANPIVLHPENTDISSAAFTISTFNEDGSPATNGSMFLLTASGLTQGDDTFSVPGASGCGVASALDSAINSKEGLPSAAGNNSLTLTNSSSSLLSFNNPSTRFPTLGQQLSAAWHAAVCDGVCVAPTATPTASPTPSPTPAPVAPPTVTHVTSGGASTTVGATLMALPSAAYTINLYAQAACDTSGTGAVMLDSVNVTTDGTGRADFAKVIPSLVPEGQFVLATATNTANGSSSAFSDCATAAARVCPDQTMCDGYTDTQIIALGETPFTYCALRRADMNGDGSVNGGDLAAFARWFTRAVPPAPSRVDLTRPLDGSINGQDLSVLASSFTRSVMACP